MYDVVGILWNFLGTVEKVSCRWLLYPSEEIYELIPFHFFNVDYRTTTRRLKSLGSAERKSETE